MDRFSGYFSDDRKRPECDSLKTKYQLSILSTLKRYVNVRVIAEGAGKAGFNLRGFQTSESFELYYDVFRQRRRICYVSKGWTDPGLRVGEQIEIDRKIPAFKEKLPRIFNIASKNLISVGILDSSPAKVTLLFQIGIYKDGFNAGVFEDAVWSMDESLGDVRQLLA